jgi:NADPH:quinone reductase-like Zn-dependent oxidoreductase/SAM-dependent methyltransferase/short-subunit dehydrogenase/acyl carrier protein
MRPATKLNMETCCGDLHFFDASGQTVAQLKGLIVKRSSADALRRCIQGDSDKLLYEVKWQPETGQSRTQNILAADYLPTPEQVAAGVQNRVAELAAQNYIGTYEELFPQMDAMCLAFVIEALRELGWQPERQEYFTLDSLARQLAVVDEHRLLLGRFLEMLAEDGYIENTASGFQMLKVPATSNPEEQLASLLKRYPEAAAELTLTGHFGRNMSAALHGERDAVQLLFPDGSLESAERLYQDSPYFRFYNCLIQATVADALARLPAGRAVRILEIGAGTGGTTYRVLQKLPAEQTEYVFTDVSNHFLLKARAKFGNYPYVRYQLLDIEQDPEEQGFASHSFDLILASNVLHATADLRKTMHHVKRLLGAQGLLIMLEATRPQRFGDLIVGLTEGWWKFTDSDLRPSHALMARENWLRLISEAGFEAPCALNGRELDSGVFSSQAVILARGAPLTKEISRVSGELIQDKHSWVIFSDKKGVGAGLADCLAASGQCLCRVETGADFAILGDGNFRLNPAKPTDFQRLFDLLHDSDSSSHSRVVYLWPLDVDLSENTDPAQLEAGQKLVCGAALSLVQTLAKSDPRRLAGLWLVTQGAQAIGVQSESIVPAQSSLWGFGRTVAIEHPQMKCMLVDLDSCDPQAASKMLADELNIGHGATQVAWRNKSRYVARLTRRTKGHASQAARDTASFQPVRLISTTPGILDGLQLQALTRRPPGPGEVEIEVHATGLNFRDVLMAMGMYPGGQDVLGVECSGKVAAIGDRVHGLKAGDDVAGIASGGFGTYVTTDARLVARLPQGLGFEEAATIPSVFLTADYTLNHLARISSGDSVLIHAAAGGVGMAALQLAKRAGAVIYATAGSDEKRALIRSLGVEHVMDSRSLVFAEEIMTRTEGAGVDVVLNSLSGDFIPKSLSVVKPDGIFLEIGRRDIWEAARVAKIRPDVTYFTINLMETCQQEPEFIGKSLARLMDAFEQGRLEPLPRHVYPLDRVSDAFRFMAQAKHMGKIVVVHSPTDTSHAAVPGVGGQAVSISAQGAYLITGGLGGLGLQVARWLVQRGARYLILMGRSSPSQEAHGIIEKLRMAGASVRVAQGDISGADDLERALSQISGDGWQLQGVFHCAGLLADGILAQQNWQRFAQVMAPKVIGLWNLHCLTRHLPLDLFVIFSSAVSLLGSAGQANHASACAFEDALAHYRRAHGMPAVSINWGPWSSVGAVVKHQVGERLMSRGIQPLSPSESLQAMKHIMDENFAQAMVLRADWQKFLTQFPSGGVPSIFNELTAELPQYLNEASQRKSPDLLTQVKGAKPIEIRKLLQNHVRQVVIQVLGLEANFSIDLRQGLRDIGMDSLMSLELRNRLQASSGQSLPSTLAFDCPTVETLADFLAGKLSASMPVQAKPAVQRMDSPGEQAAEVNQLSEEEAEALLIEELSKGKSRKS